MTYYYIVFLLTLLIQFINVKNEKQYLWRVIITFLPVFLLGALRTSWTDYDEYEMIFYEVHKWINNLTIASDHSEYGFLLLNSIVPTWRLFLIITTTFSCFGFGYIFYKCIPPKYGWLAVILFFLASDKTFVFMFSGIRNALAIAIFCLTLTLVENRRWFVFVFFVLLAMQFHTSAILFMPLAYLTARGSQMTKKEGWIWIGVMLILQIVSLNSLFEQVTDFVSFTMERYSVYAVKAGELGDTRSVLIRFVSAILVSFFVWFMRTTELTKTENVVCRVALLYSMSHLLGSLNFRLVQCFIIFFICGVVIMFSKWRQREVALGFTLFVCAYLWFALFDVYMQSPDFELTKTYQSIFNT